jgi:hypothetical protein
MVVTDRTSTGVGELPHPLEAHAHVAMFVGGVRRFKVGGHSVEIDQRKVMLEQRHAEPLAAMVGMGSQETQVLVGLVARVSGIDAHKQFSEVVRRRTQILVGELGELLLLVLVHPGAAWGNPDGGGLAMGGGYSRERWRDRRFEKKTGHQ